MHRYWLSKLEYKRQLFNHGAFQLLPYSLASNQYSLSLESTPSTRIEQGTQNSVVFDASPNLKIAKYFEINACKGCRSVSFGANPPPSSLKLHPKR